ncbi:MAG: histidinol-phosphatase HisJ family protein [Clostridia bacterium]|nr:histidinol-phosphatase HisJ family protein [Clostridia bacterium]
MKIYNCHTHTAFSHDAIATIDELCASAVRNMLSGFAVTDHCDCEYSDDTIMLKNLGLSYSEAEKYKEIYKDRLIISRGIEIGEALYNPDFAKKIIASHNYDVVLGSVHAVRIKDYEMPFSLIDFSVLPDSFIDSYVTQYFADLLETAQKTDYDILCHLTVVLRYVVYKYNRAVDINKHLPVITNILEEVIRRNKTLEVNTSGFDDGYFMPDEEIIRLYKALGGKRITLGSDAHSHAHIAKGLMPAAEKLKSFGFDELTYYENRKAISYKI